MATYKVIQDVEAEDKILGPLSLKQFAFAGVAMAISFLAFMVAKATVIYTAIVFVPLIVPPLLLALPLGRDQPTDVWLAAQIRFFLKPRRRIWDQSGIKDLVTITVPKRIERIYTNGLDQNEVRSRLKALADTIDSRGWAVKNVNVNLYSNPAHANISDRLVDPASLPQTVQATDIRADDDMLDPFSNPTAQHFDQLVQQAALDRRADAMATVQAARQQTASQQPATTPDDFYFLHQPPQEQVPRDATMFAAQVVTPKVSSIEDSTFLHDDTAMSIDEQAALEEIKSHKNTAYINPHHKTLKTTQQQLQEEQLRQQAVAAQEAAETPVTPPKSRATIELSQTNDVSVASIASIAKHEQTKREALNDGDEVVVSLR